MTDPTTPADSVELLRVTRADREAAAAFIRREGASRIDESVPRMYERGDRDDQPLVQMLARHRLSAESAHAEGWRDIASAPLDVELWLTDGTRQWQGHGFQWEKMARPLFTPGINKVTHWRPLPALPGSSPASAEGWPSREAVDTDALARLIFPDAASAWDREVQAGLDKGMSRPGAVDDAYHYTKDFRPEVNWIACRQRVRDAILALFRSPPASATPEPTIPEVDALREALGQIAAKNDLSGVADDAVEAEARSALYDCECIARAALSTGTGGGAAANSEESGRGR